MKYYYFASKLQYKHSVNAALRGSCFNKALYQKEIDFFKISDDALWLNQNNIKHDVVIAVRHNDFGLEYYYIAIVLYDKNDVLKMKLTWNTNPLDTSNTYDLYGIYDGENFIRPN